MIQERGSARADAITVRRLSGWPVRVVAVAGLTATVAAVYRVRSASHASSTNPEANGAEHSDAAAAASLDFRTRALIFATRVLPTPVLIRLSGVVAKFSRPQEDTTTADRETVHDG